MLQDLWIRSASVAILGTTLIVGTLIGCSRGPKIVPVSGKLTRNGQPVPNLEVNFLPTEGTLSVGVTDTAGQFKLGSMSHRDGAAVGTHTVFVTYNPPNELEGASPSNLNDILAKYGSKEVSPLKIVIAKAEKDLEIKLD